MYIYIFIYLRQCGSLVDVPCYGLDGSKFEVR